MARLSDTGRSGSVYMAEVGRAIQAQTRVRSGELRTWWEV